MRWTWVLILVFGCQEYGFVEPPDQVDLPPLPPTVPADPPPDPPPPDEPALAEFPVYANTRDQLFQVEPATGARTPIGTFHFADGTPLSSQLAPNDGMTDIAIDSQGRMYGGTHGALYRIDAETAQVEFVCDTFTERQMYAMAFTPDDELIASGSDGTIRIFETNNCETTVVLDSPIYDTSGDLVGSPSGHLYWTVKGDPDGGDGLVRIDPDGWFVQYLGELPFASLYGLSYADGELFGFNSEGKTIVIQPPGAPPADGMVTAWTVDDDDSIQWWGATTNPTAWGE